MRWNLWEDLGYKNPHMQVGSDLKIMAIVVEAQPAAGRCKD